MNRWYFRKQIQHFIVPWMGRDTSSGKGVDQLGKEFAVVNSSACGPNDLCSKVKSLPEVCPRI